MHFCGDAFVRFHSDRALRFEKNTLDSKGPISFWTRGLLYRAHGCYVQRLWIYVRSSALRLDEREINGSRVGDKRKYMYWGEADNIRGSERSKTPSPLS